MWSKPNARDAASAIKELVKIKVPEGGDVDGEPLNSPNVLRLFPARTQDVILHNTALVAEYLRRDDDMGAVPNKRGLNSLRRKGFEVSLNQDQYDTDRLVGYAGDGNVHVDISDPSNGEDEQD